MYNEARHFRNVMQRTIDSTKRYANMSIEKVDYVTEGYNRTQLIALRTPYEALLKVSLEEGLAEEAARVAFRIAEINKALDVIKR